MASDSSSPAWRRSPGPRARATRTRPRSRTTASCPDWVEFAKRCHRHGAKAAAQLQHASKVAQEDVKAGRPMWVPSLPEPKVGDLFAELTREEVAKAASAYQAPGREGRVPRDGRGRHRVPRRALRGRGRARAARRARRRRAPRRARLRALGVPLAGLEPPHGRVRRLARERARASWSRALRAVRARVGRGFRGLVPHRRQGVQRSRAASPRRMRCRTAELAEAAGADAVHVSAYAEPTSAIAFTEAPLVHQPAGYLPFAEAIKKRLRIPVIAVGRLEPDVADEALRDGRCDFVAMGRKLLADPELPRRLAEGRPEAARPCVYAYRCVGNVFLREASRCVVNPELGREAELAVAARLASAPRGRGGRRAGRPRARAARRRARARGRAPRAGGRARRPRPPRGPARPRERALPALARGRRARRGRRDPARRRGECREPGRERGRLRGGDRRATPRRRGRARGGRAAGRVRGSAGRAPREPRPGATHRGVGQRRDRREGGGGARGRRPRRHAARGRRVRPGDGAPAALARGGSARAPRRRTREERDERPAGGGRRRGRCAETGWARSRASCSWKRRASRPTSRWRTSSVRSGPRCM